MSVRFLTVVTVLGLLLPNASQSQSLLEELKKGNSETIQRAGNDESTSSIDREIQNRRKAIQELEQDLAKSKRIIADLESKGKCEDAKSNFDASRESVRERLDYSHDSCLNRRLVSRAKTSKNPRTILASALSLEDRRQISDARDLYRLLLNEFPGIDESITAGLRLSALSDQARAEEALQRTLAEQDRRRNQAIQKESDACSFRISRCTDSCARLSGAAWRACDSRCESICSR